jgi:sugar phosphate permease
MRLVLGVVVAFVSMSLIVFGLSIAPWFILGLDAVLLPGRFDSTAAFNVYAVIVGLLGALFAGWLCATISRSKRAVIVLAVLCFAAGMTNALGQMNKPEPGARASGMAVMEAMTTRKEPAWFTFLMPCVGVIGVLVAGRRANGGR